MSQPRHSAECERMVVSHASPLPLWKRAIDLTCCLIAAPVFLLAMSALWLLLAVTSPGPLFFRQERVGYKGRRFTLFKFRTMHVGADTGVHQAHVAELVRSNVPMKKMDATGDRRLVPFGWLLRATGLDELPQLINVAIGDMSIVGPRPCIPYEYEQYSTWQRERFNAVPGLTGLWQVSGKNRTTFEEMIRLDIRYSETKTFLGDLGIIFRTPTALVTQVLDTRAQRKSAVPASTVSTPPVATRRPAPFQA